MGKGGQGQMPAEEVKVYLKGKVVDVTKFQRSHPGGAKALRIFKDRDATEQFNMCACSSPVLDSPGAHLARPASTRYHSPAAHKKLDLMMKGAPDAPTDSTVAGTKLGLAFKELDDRLHDAGLYEPVYGDEAFKLFLTIGPVRSRFPCPAHSTGVRGCFLS